MAEVTIAGLTAILAVNLTDAAEVEIRDANGQHRKGTVAQLRTQLNTGAQAFTATASFAGAITASAGAITRNTAGNPIQQIRTPKSSGGGTDADLAIFGGKISALADSTATQVDIPTSNGVLEIYVVKDSDYTVHSAAQYAMRSNSAEVMDNVGGLIELYGSGTLAGTTGTNLKFNFSTKAGAGFSFENRLGYAVSFFWKFSRI